MEIDPELLEDTQNVAKAFGLELIANDYIVNENETKHLLEVNHIPNVSRFPEIWAAYLDYATAWVNQSVVKGIS
jgi:glutathione synthase/RimK-type ligase-like ATP-grasp enzyme